MKTISRVVVTFVPDGSIEVAVSYVHGDELVPTPGSKRRATSAARMAQEGLRAALESG